MVLGRFAGEKQYGDALETKLKEQTIPYKREQRLGRVGNILDFVVDEKIVVELKAKTALVKDDYFQLQRYLQSTQLLLGLLVNFRNRYIKPVRVIRIDTDAKNKFRTRDSYS